MSFINRILQYPNKLLYNAGKMAYADYFIRQLPSDARPKAKRYFQELTFLDNQTADPHLYFKKLGEFARMVEDCKPRALGPEVSKFYYPGGAPTFFGPRSQGTKIWSFFPNPFQVFSYFQQNYWAVQRCINLIRETVGADGFALKASEGMSEETLMERYKELSKIDIESIYVEFCVHYALFGNFWALPHYGKRSRKLVKYEIMFPPRLQPVLNPVTETIEKYIYYMGRMKREYDVDDLDHAMMPSTDGKVIGPPLLLACTTEIETALMTMTFNNDVMQKGGLMGKIIALEQPSEDNPITNSVSDDWVRQVQNQLQFLYGGTKGANGIMAMAGVKDVHNVNDPGAIELNFRESRDGLDKRICTTLGIPSEKIGIPRSTTAQYQPSLVENVVNAQFDATINWYTAQACKFLNKHLLQEHMGITDVKIVPAGRYGAITLAAAQTVKEMAQAGPITTVNEARTHILGWAPLPPNDPRGNMVLDNTMNRDPEAVRAQIAPEPVDPELEMENSLGKISEGLYIRFGGVDEGQISKQRPRILRQEFAGQES